MKRISLSIAALMMTATLYAEADFNTVQAMIGKGEYQTALYALQIIEKNHPGMAKVQYTIAQAQAGIGNLPAAKVALAKAQAIDPKLAFVPESQVKELTAIINEVRVIKKVEQSSHWFLYTVLAGISALGVALFLKRRKEEAFIRPEPKQETRTEPTPRTYSGSTGSTRTSTSNVGSSSNYNTQSMNRQYKNGYPTREVEVHHYHDNSSNVGTAIAAGAVAGITTSVLTNAMLNESHHNHDFGERGNGPLTSHRDYFSNSTSSRNDSDSLSSLNLANSREKEEVSNTWNDNSSSSGISDTWKDDSSSSSVSNSWEDEESTRSSSWESSSSDDSSSYSSSSDSSSSSSWDN